MIIGLVVAGPIPIQQAFAGPTGGVVAVGDFDGDGDSDVMFKNNVDNEIATWLLENIGIVLGGGFFVGSTQVVSGAAMIDADKISDVFIWDSATSDLYIWFMGIDGASGQVTITGSAFVGNTGGYVPMAFGQFNPATDSVPDVVLRHPSAGDVAIWLINQSGNYAGGGFVGNPTTQYNVLTTGDFNTASDVSTIVFWNDTLKEVAFWELSGNIVGGAFEITRGSGFGGLTDHILLNATDDMNSDGKDDIVVQNNAGDMFAWFMSADAMTPPTISGAASTGPAGVNKAVALGQLNPGDGGDEEPDIFLEDRTTTPSEVNVGAWLTTGGVFAGGGFVGAPPAKYGVVNTGE